MAAEKPGNGRTKGTTLRADGHPSMARRGWTDRHSATRGLLKNRANDRVVSPDVVLIALITAATMLTAAPLFAEELRAAYFWVKDGKRGDIAYTYGKKWREVSLKHAGVEVPAAAPVSSCCCRTS